MSTGDFEPGPSRNVMQFTGDGLDPNMNNQGERDLYQFNNPGDGPTNLQAEGWDIPRGQTRNYSFPTDGQGFPVINNYGTVNIYTAGGNGYDDASCRAMQAAKLADMTSGRYDNYDDRERQNWSPDYNRMSDFRREALIRDGQRQDDMYRANFDRDFNDYAYRRPGQYTNYSHGGRDGLSYYESGPSYNRMPPYVNDDCFGTGNGDSRAMQRLLETGLTAALAFKYANNNRHNNRYDDRYSGRWDRGRDNNGGMNDIEYMLMDRAINGGRSWNRDPRMFAQNTNYSHGGPDGLSYYNSAPSYDQYSGPGRNGFERVVGDILPIAQTVLPAVLAFKYADNDGGYNGYQNVQPYYNDDHRSQQMAYNRHRHDYMAHRDAERIQRNRERAYQRREFV